MSGKDFMSWIVQLKMQLKICSVWFSYQFWFYIKCTVFILICLLSKYGGKNASSFNHPSVWTNYSNCNITSSDGRHFVEGLSFKLLLKSRCLLVVDEHT